MTPFKKKDDPVVDEPVVEKAPVKETTPAEDLQHLIVTVQGTLASAVKLAASVPEASAVQPVIREANRAFSQVGFSAEVGKLSDG